MFTVCLSFLMIFFSCIHWGRDTYLREYFNSPVEGLIPPGSVVTVSGQVYQKEQTSEYQVLYLKNNSINSGERVVPKTKIIIYLKGSRKVCLGNSVMAEGKLTFWEEERNPGGFDQKSYYRNQGIAAALWCEQIQVSRGEVYALREMLNSFRRRCGEFLTEAAGESHGGILRAMLFGDRRELEEETKELYQVNGMAHILAISGLHLSFAGMGVYRLVRRLTGSYPAAGIAGIAFLLVYILMVGNTVSAIRAVIMFCIRVGADMCGRVYDPPTAVAAAAAGIVLFRPLSFYDAGFQLSFSAICGILFVYPQLVRILTGDGKRGLKSAVLASASVQLATLPVILWHYFEVPVYSVFLNLVVIPLMSGVLFFGFAGSMLCWVWMDGGKCCVGVCRVILEIYEFLCKFINHIPGNRVITGRPSFWGVFVYYLSLFFVLFLIYFRETRKKKKAAGGEKAAAGERRSCRMAAAAGISIGVAGMALSCPFLPGKGLEMVFLDVGQGDCIFVQEEHGITCLIDGGSSDVSRVGKYRIEPFLKSRGVSKVDYVFVTHGDQDHINGIRELLSREAVGVEIGMLVFPDRQVWDEELLELYEIAFSQNIPAAEIKKGQIIRGNRLSLVCLAPKAENTVQEGNEASMVLHVSYGELDILLTGDIEGDGEENLTNTLEKPVEILKAAHHGSENSTSEEFLRKTRPELTVISAGRENSYGHPHMETLERLEESGSVWLCTAESGAIILRMEGKEVENLKIIQYNKSYEKFE